MMQRISVCFMVRQTAQLSQTQNSPHYLLWSHPSWVGAGSNLNAVDLPLMKNSCVWFRTTCLKLTKCPSSFFGSGYSGQQLKVCVTEREGTLSPFLQYSSYGILLPQCSTLSNNELWVKKTALNLVKSQYLFWCLCSIYFYNRE